jgi:mannosyltransferase
MGVEAVAPVAEPVARPAHRLRGPGVVLVAFAVSFAGAWNVSLWKDEADTLSAADRTVAQIWQLAQNLDAVHAAYYVAMHGWISLFGRSDVAVRLPSALAVALTALGVLVLADRLGLRRAAVPAALLCAVLPRLTWAGIEARPFAFTALGAVWATVLVLSAVRRGGVLRWSAYALVAGASVAVNLFSVLVVVAHGVSLVVLRPRDRATWWGWTAASAGGVLLASPLVLRALGQSGQLGDDPIGPGAIPRNVAVNQWFLGSTPSPVSGGAEPARAAWDVGGAWAVGAVLLAAVVWGLIAVAVVSGLRRVPADGDRPDERLALAWLLPWLLVPTAVVVGYTLVGGGVYNPRYLTMSAPAVALLAATGLRRLHPARLQLAVAVLVVLLALPVWVSQRQVLGKSSSDWVLAAAHVQERSEPGQWVYFAPRTPPPPGATISPTTRYLATAYPDAFAGLEDLTLRVPGRLDGTLNGRSAPLDEGLAAAGARVGDLWAVWRTDYPADALAAERALIEDTGLRAVDRWLGPSTLVVEFSRGGDG